MERFQTTNIFFLLESYEKMEELAKEENRKAMIVSQTMGAFGVFASFVMFLIAFASGFTWSGLSIGIIAFLCFGIFNSISEHYFEKAVNIQKQFSPKQKEAYIESLHLIYGKEMQ